jgi:uncharacterized membrane protein HdeD (DUF308 family)
MLQAIARNWWVLLLKGICAILFGFLAFWWPLITIQILAILFAAHAVAAGAAAVTLGVAGRKKDGVWWEMVFLGLLAIAAGTVTFLWPGLSALALLYCIAAWAIACGSFQIAAAIKLRKLIANEWFLIITGIASVAFGVLLVIAPGDGALALLWLIASFAIVFGILEVVLALRLRKLAEKLSAIQIPRRMRSA